MRTASRPIPITVISWIWIITGVLMVFSASMALIFFPPFSYENVDSQVQHGMGMLRHFELLAVAQLLLGFVAVIAGVQFLRLHSWARSILETICWISLAYVVGSGIFWAFHWWTTDASFPPESAHMYNQGHAIAGFITGTILIVTFGIPLCLMIYCLRGTVVRQALQQSRRG